MSDIKFTEFVEQLPDRPISSVNEVALLYSVCSQIDKKSRFRQKHDEFDVSAEVLKYLTPNSIETGEDKILISAQLDLTDDKPSLDEEEPVKVERLSEDLKYKSGYISNPGKAGPAIDYSVSNHLGSGGSSANKVAYDSWGNRFLRGRFEKWARSFSDDFLDNRWEYNIVDSMQEISKDENEMKRLEENLLEKFGEEETLEGLVSVKVRVDENKGYQYPAEFNELNSAGVEKAKEKLKEGRAVPNPSFSEDSTGIISGEDGTVVGASKGVFARYGKKQRDAFPDLDATRGWQQRPIVDDVAKTLVDFNEIEDQFGYSIRNFFVLFLPYPKVELESESLSKFYKNVYSILKDTEEPLEYMQKVHQTVTYNYEAEIDDKDSDSIEELEKLIEYESKDGGHSDYKLFGLVTNREQSSLYNTYFQSLNVRTDILTKLNVEYNSIVESMEYKEPFRQLFDNMVDSGFDLFDSEYDVIGNILYGGFIEQLVSDSPSPSDINSDKFGSSSDPRLKYTVPVLSGNKIDSEDLIQKMVYKTVSENRSGDEPFNDVWPVLQWMVLHSLDSCDVLAYGRFIKDDSKYKIMGTASQAENRKERLKSFLDSNTVLSDTASRYAFILGGLVGRLTAYQNYNDISTTLVDQYPVDYLTKLTIKDVTKSVQQKNREYESVEDISMNRRYMNRLSEIIEDPESWNVSNTHLQWVYSLGIAYGRNDSSSNIDKKGDKNGQ
jgi:hypothetical protein